MTNLGSILKCRDITLPTKVCIIKTVVFPVVMYGYESWTIKKAECRRIDAFERWCLRTLERPLDCMHLKAHMLCVTFIKYKSHSLSSSHLSVPFIQRREI